MDIVKQSSLATQKRTINFDEEQDLCPVCNYNLYHSEKLTKRVGLIDKKETLTGWLCPHCKSEFNLKNDIVELFDEDVIKGEA